MSEGQCHTDEPRGRIFKTESLNTHNGPGYRTVIWLKGCPMNCLWCHNPEGISPKKEIWVMHSRCIGCLSCVSACPESALSYVDNKIEVDRKKCAGCHTCIAVCPSKAIEKLGDDLTVTEVLKKILSDKPFLDASGGGITVTGGEPGAQSEFVARLFEKCREENIHTAFDTSGFISENALERIIPFTDLVFFDLKIMDEKYAREMTGQGTALIFQTLEWIRSYILQHGRPELQFRTPIIPGITGSVQNLEMIAQVIGQKYMDIFSEWELNLFNDICEDKYLRMNKKWHFKDLKMNESDYLRLEKFQKDHKDLKVRVSGFYEKTKNHF